MLSPNTFLQDRYRVVRQLGQGGMSTVYEAVDQRLSSVVAIKETLVTTDEARRAFEREASLLANLRHPSLPNVIDHFSENESQYLVMEFIPGDDLAQLLDLRGRPFPTADVLCWGDELLKALEYLHGHNPPILHRDIKPSNLKLTRGGELFLLDFGLAKGAAGQMPTLLTSRSVKGYTPAYSPLEQIHGVGTDPRSDLYSLGATLYHFVTGIVPVDAPTRFISLEEEQPDPLRPADDANPDVPHKLAEVLSAAMSMNRRHRPESAKAMRRLLREAGESLAHPDASEARTRDFESGVKPVVPPPPTERGSLDHGEAAPRILSPTIPATAPLLLGATSNRSSAGSDAVPSRRRRVSRLAIASLVLLVFFLLILGSVVFAPGLLAWLKGRSNASANSNGLESISHSQTTPSSSPTPTPTPTPEPSIRDVNFKTRKYDFSVPDDPEFVVRPGKNTIVRVSYGDLNADNIEEAAVVVHSLTSLGYRSRGFVYTMKNGKLAEVARVEGGKFPGDGSIPSNYGDKFNGGLMSADVRTGLLVVARCYGGMSSYTETTTFRLNGNRLISIATPIRKKESCPS